MLLRALSSVPRCLTRRFSQKAIEQLIVTGTSSFAMVVGNPWIAEWLGGSGQWLDPSRSFTALGLTTLLSTIPVRVLKPIGYVLQNQGSIAKNFAGFLIMVELETLYSIIGFQILAPTFRWDQEKALWASVVQGSTRSASGILIAKKWGRGSDGWSVMRQLTMLAMVANSSAMTTIASTDRESWFSKHYIGEITGFNLLMAGLVLLTPRRLF